MVIKNIIFIPIFLSLLCSFTQAQKPTTDIESQSEMKKLSFITGSWKGTGWRMDRQGNKHQFDQTEVVQFKIDSTAILIEGKGKVGSRIIHNALAIITFNKEKNSYNFQSYLSTSRSGNFRAELKGDTFYWFPNENMRYIISLNENDQWYEIGEMKRNGKWIKFFEMTLDKIELPD